MNRTSDPETLEANPEKRANVAQHARWLVRVACLVLAAVALAPVPGWHASLRFLPAASPFVALAATVATGALQGAAVVGLLLLLTVAVFRRRWFCRWICPTGLCADGASWLGRRLGRRCPPLPPIGIWVLLITLGGAAVGYPLLLWLDPLAILASSMAAADPRSTAIAWWSGVAGATVITVSIAFPRLWCLRLCPAGALQDLAAQAGGLLQRGGSQLQQRSRAMQRVRLTRRVILFGGLGTAWGAMARRVRAASTHPLRPPGAIDAAVFGGVCIRCGNCLRVCPAGIIQPEWGEGGIATLLTPLVRFTDDYCREDCTRCTEVCPSGALARVAAAAKGDAVMGIARVDMDLCLLGDNRDCAACRSHCPYDAIRFVFCEESYTLTPQIDPATCPGCGACEIACPTRPVPAITVHPR